MAMLMFVAIIAIAIIAIVVWIIVRNDILIWLFIWMLIIKATLVS